MKNLTLSLLALSLISQTAFAQKEEKKAPAEATAEETEDFNRYREWLRRWSWSIGPRYLNQSNDKADGAFTTNGFQAPKKSLLGAEFEMQRHCDHGWSLGLGFSWLGSQRENANFEAAYRTSTVALKGGYDVLHGNADSALVLGAGVGLASTQLEVFSAVKDGQRNSGSLYLEPSVTYYHRLAYRFRMGLRASYFATLGESSDSRGDNLGVTDISPRGFSASLLFNIGRFGER